MKPQVFTITPEFAGAAEQWLTHLRLGALCDLWPLITFLRSITASDQIEADDVPRYLALAEIIGYTDAPAVPLRGEL